MSSTFTLDAIREAADAKYGHTEIVVDEATTVRLLNPLRLPKGDRNKLLNIQESMEGEDVEQGDVFREAILTVAENKRDAQKLITAVGDDLALLAEIFTTYTEGTAVGEASASAN